MTMFRLFENENIMNTLGESSGDVEGEWGPLQFFVSIDHLLCFVLPNFQNFRIRDVLSITFS